MYTSYSKINDRFGFSTGGTFRCAYRNTRTYMTVGVAVILLIAALIAVSAVYVAVKSQGLGNAVAAQTGVILDNLIHGRGFVGDGEAGGQLMDLGFGIVGLAFGIILLVISVIVFIIFTAVLKAGQTYKFSADEEKFTVIYPKNIGGSLTIEYDYITGLTYEEWRYLFSPRCLDVTVHTRQGEFTFRCIHTPMSKANGITETPFNIIRERIGLAHKDENVLIDRDAANENEPGFFSF